MKRVIAAVLLLVLALSACGGSASVTVDLASVKQTMISDLQIVDPLEVPAERLVDLYNIPVESIKTSACFITPNN